MTEPRSDCDLVIDEDEAKRHPVVEAELVWNGWLAPATRLFRGVPFRAADKPYDYERDPFWSNAVK